MPALLKRFNHYGFDKETYDECGSLIEASNRGHARIINLWFVLVNAFYYLSATFGLFNVDPERRVFYGVFMLAGILIIVLTMFAEGRRPVFGLIATVLDLVMFEAYSVLASNAEPYTTCWIFLILMVIVALSYVETLGRMSFILLAMSVIFCYLSYLNKPLSIATMDLANTVIVASLALVLHFAFQRSRISEFVTRIHYEKTQRMLEVSSHFDALTSLLNRGKFFAMTEQVIEQRKPDELVALVILDLDEFKQINDSLGHQAGDAAIKLAAEAIRRSLEIDLTDQWDFPNRALRDRASYAGRLGGDEFVILLQGFASREEMVKAAENILHALHGVDEGEIHGLKASMGITMITDADKNSDSAYKRADHALYASKGNGKDRITVHEF